MNELRRNPVTGRWVSVAPRRGRRPQDRDGEEDAGKGEGIGLPERDPACPFCPGNEEELPEILWESPAADPPGWWVRAVPNRYPAFEPHDGEGVPRDLPRDEEGTVPGVGHQEVIIESPRHDARLATMSAPELEALVEGHWTRYRTHAERDPGGRVLLFRNHGGPAGASLLHPHAQLIAVPFVPPGVREREARLEAYREEQGRCLVCTLGDRASGRGQRVVAESSHFRALVPWAAEVPLELWIVPLRHQAGFHECGPEERRDLATVLGRALRCYRTLAGDPPHNYLLHSSPPARSGHPGHHWFVQLRPRLHQMAGFELESGIVINPSLPESDAEALREAWKGDLD